MALITIFRKHWIPPGNLALAHLAHGASWAIVFYAAWSGHFGDPFYRFAWIHTVALGWITMAALGVLLHAIPTFVDVPWKGDVLARWSLPVYAAGVALLVYAFLERPYLLGIAGVVLFVALALYVATAAVTLAGALRGERVQRAVARAFLVTFALLLATAYLGMQLARSLGGETSAGWLARFPPVHGNLGMLGWISLLIFGVSMRTFRPITGARTRFPLVHALVGSLALLGVVCIAFGVGAIGGALFSAAVLAYVFDTADILRRSTNRHRLPQAFVVASELWLLFALVAGAQTLLGKPWQDLYAFALLAGWAGQMLNGHLHHIGVRLIATVFRGEEDETEPQELLVPRLGWYAFLAFQAALAIVAAALLRNDPGLAARGAVFGATGWIAITANVAVAALRAKNLIASRT